MLYRIPRAFFTFLSYSSFAVFLIYTDAVDVKGTVTEAERFSFKPALISLTTVGALALLCQLPGWVSLILIPFTLLGYAIALFVILGMGMYFFIKKRPRRGASVLSVILLPALLWRPLIWSADLVHLGLTTGFGVGQLGTPRKSRVGDFIVYDWSVGLAISPSIFLIHDGSDEISLPMAQHPHPASSEIGFGEECAGKVEHLIRHYYICTIE
jgi:hypothetical protein